MSVLTILKLKWYHEERIHSEEITCEEPLLTVDRQMGLNIVHPEGKVRALQYQ